MLVITCGGLPVSSPEPWGLSAWPSPASLICASARFRARLHPHVRLHESDSAMLQAAVHGMWLRADF